jgi:SAM-dependent methyltransferase
MQRISITEISHQILQSNLNKDSIVIDATCGNGNDTLFLAKIAKEVYAFDIQEKAIKQTKALTKEFTNIFYHHDSFVRMLNYVLNYDGVIFNLGYLPKSDHLLTTNHVDLIDIIKKLHVRKQGFILVVLYPGHIEGLKETVALQHFVDQHDIKYEVIKVPYDTKKEAPYILFWKY